MASEPDYKGDSNSDDSSDLEPEKLVDGRSSKFNPQIALLCEEKALHISKDAPVFLNVFELEKAIPDPRKPPIKKSSLDKSKAIKQALISGSTSSASSSASTSKTVTAGSTTSSTTTATTAAQSAPSSSGTAEPFYPIPGRKFLPHQLPVYRPPKEHPNVLKVMDTIEGPLGALREAMKLKRKVKVWTRGASGIRGCLTGFIQGFDRHWNLALWDVQEFFQRRRCNVKREKCHEDGRFGSVTCKEMKEKNESAILVDSSDALVLFRLHMNVLDGSSDSVQQTLTTETTDVSLSQLRKKRLTILKEPFKDPFGFLVIAQSRDYEIVKRTKRKLFLVGNEVAFVETNPKW